MKDLIYRQQAIDVASGYCHPANIADELRKLPSAQKATGKWVWSKEDSSWCCGVCRCVFEEIEWKPEYNFCPNCGARMEGEQDET